MATRKQTISATPFVESTATESVAPEFTLDWKTLLIGTASWKRFIAATLVSLAVSTSAASSLSHSPSALRC